jgi:hypothetical protein
MEGGVTYDDFNGQAQFAADMTNMLGDDVYKSAIVERINNTVSDFVLSLMNIEGTNIDRIADLLRKAKAITIHYLECAIHSDNCTGLMVDIVEIVSELGVSCSTALFNRNDFTVDVYDLNELVCKVPAAEHFSVIDGLNALPTNESWRTESADEIWGDMLNEIGSACQNAGGGLAEPGTFHGNMIEVAKFGGPIQWARVFVARDGQRGIIVVAACRQLTDSFGAVDETDIHDRYKFADQWGLAPKAVRRELDKGVLRMQSYLRLSLKEMGFEIDYRTPCGALGDYDPPLGPFLDKAIFRAGNKISRWHRSLCAKIAKTSACSGNRSKHENLKHIEAVRMDALLGDLVSE